MKGPIWLLIGRPGYLHDSAINLQFEVDLKHLVEFPLGPFTVTFLSASEKVQVTPLGSAMGSLPIRDIIFLLINVAQYFSTNIQGTRLLVSDYTF